MTWFLVLHIIVCPALDDKCYPVPKEIAMPSKEVCHQVKALNGTLGECWAKETK